MSLRVAKHIWHPQKDQHHTHMTAQRVFLITLQSYLTGVTYSIQRPKRKTYQKKHQHEEGVWRIIDSTSPQQKQCCSACSVEMAALKCF